MAIKIDWRNSYWLVILGILIVAYLFIGHWFIYHEISAAKLNPTNQQPNYMIKSSHSTEKKSVYAALGDSLTAGVGTENYEQSYPYLVSEKAAAQGASNLSLKSFAYPGARTADLINDLLSPAIAAQPNLVTLLIGTNDIHGNVDLETFRKNYQLILERLTKETRAKIYLISIPFIGSESLLLPPYDYYFGQQVIEYNKSIQTLALKYNLTYIDIATPTRALFQKDGAHYAADNFHPSAIGYQEWAQLIYDHLNF